MELTQMSDTQVKFLQDISNHIDKIVAVIDNFEGCRYGSMVFTKLEEVMHWSNSLVARGTLKVEEIPAVTQ